MEGEVVSSIYESCFFPLTMHAGSGHRASEREFLHANIIDSPPFIMLAVRLLNLFLARWQACFIDRMLPYSTRAWHLV